jgi:hypothetical protein
MPNCIEYIRILGEKLLSSGITHCVAWTMKVTDLLNVIDLTLSFEQNYIPK